jgi:hypothetical protein
MTELNPFAINQAMRQRPLGVVMGEFEKHVVDATSAARCLEAIRQLHSSSYTYYVDSNWLRALVDMGAYDLISYLVAYVSHNPFDLVHTSQYMLLAGSSYQAIHQLVCNVVSATFGSIPDNHGYCGGSLISETCAATLTCLRDHVFSPTTCLSTVVLLQKALDAIATLDPYIRARRWKDAELMRIIQSIQEMCAREQATRVEAFVTAAHFNKQLVAEFHTTRRAGSEVDACNWLTSHMPSIRPARTNSAT